jgi:repressor LexA
MMSTKVAKRVSGVTSRKSSSREDDTLFRSHSLAPVQRQTLEYLRSFIADKGYGPTLKDIAACIGVRSPSTAHFHLSRLEDKGFIRRGEDGSVELLNREELKSSAGPCAVPLFGLIAAGSPIEAIEDRSVTVDIPPQFLMPHKEIFCLQVTGDSMVDAHILDGDIIIIAQQETADNGQIVVALLEDGTATVKTFRRLKGGKVMLIPHNPKHSPITVDRVQIQGRVVGLLREMQM